MVHPHAQGHTYKSIWVQSPFLMHDTVAEYCYPRFAHPDFPLPPRAPSPLHSHPSPEWPTHALCFATCSFHRSFPVLGSPPPFKVFRSSMLRRKHCLPEIHVPPRCCQRAFLLLSNVSCPFSVSPPRLSSIPPPQTVCLGVLVCSRCYNEMP